MDTLEQSGRGSLMDILKSKLKSAKTKRRDAGD